MTYVDRSYPIMQLELVLMQSRDTCDATFMSQNMFDTLFDTIVANNSPKQQRKYHGTTNLAKIAYLPTQRILCTI